MGSTGAIIMSFFGCVFYLMGLGPTIGWRSALLLVPIAIFVFIVTRVAALSRRGAAQLRTSRASKAIVWSSIGEGLGILIAVNVLANLGREDLILPAIAAVVGLHFLPIAYAIPFRAFYVTAAALLIAATIGIVLRQPAGTEVTGLLAAAILWITSFAALRREARALARTIPDSA